MQSDAAFALLVFFEADTSRVRLCLDSWMACVAGHRLVFPARWHRYNHFKPCSNVLCGDRDPEGWQKSESTEDTRCHVMGLVASPALDRQALCAGIWYG